MDKLIEQVSKLIVEILAKNIDIDALAKSLAPKIEEKIKEEILWSLEDTEYADIFNEIVSNLIRIIGEDVISKIKKGLNDENK